MRGVVAAPHRRERNRWIGKSLSGDNGGRCINCSLTQYVVVFAGEQRPTLAAPQSLALDARAQITPQVISLAQVAVQVTSDKNSNPKTSEEQWRTLGTAVVSFAAAQP